MKVSGRSGFNPLKYVNTIKAWPLQSAR